jgi:hypothetical protein
LASIGIRLVGELGVDRHQIIDAGELHGVTTIIKDSNIGVARHPCELDCVLIHPGLVQIEADDGFEAGAGQRSRDILGIIPRIGQVDRVFVCAVSYHKRDALVGESGRGAPYNDGDG